jgi:predicted AAA+ superfamily ATPase
MPPNCPHAVFTPETEKEQGCLAIGGQFFTASHLHSSLEALSLQEKYPEISNEDLNDSIYKDLAKIIRTCHSITTDVEKAQIASSCSLFPSPLSEATLRSDLKSFGISAKNRHFLEYLHYQRVLR